MRNEGVFSKRIFLFIKSMAFALGVLLILALISVIGTVVPQNQGEAFYVQKYGNFIGNGIVKLGFNDLYHSFIYISMVVLLSLNLTLCSITRLPSLIKKMKGTVDIKDLKNSDYYTVIKGYQGDKARDILKEMKYRKIKRIESREGSILLATKGRIGYLGSWITHLSILILILSYAGGKVLGENTYVYGVPGTVQAISGTPYQVALEDFWIEYRDDDSINQYYSKIKLLEGDVELRDKEIYVNNPLGYKSLNIVQSGTGWAVDAELYKDDKLLDKTIMYHRDLFEGDDEKIALFFVSFYPNFYQAGHSMPVSINNRPLNPRMLYILYYDGILADMNTVPVNGEITFDQYTFKLSNPREFTVLQIVSDPLKNGALFGGVLLMIGLFISFYIHPSQAGVILDNGGRLKIFGNWPKNKSLNKEKFEEMIRRRLM